MSNAILSMGKKCNATRELPWLIADENWTHWWNTSPRTKIVPESTISGSRIGYDFLRQVVFSYGPNNNNNCIQDNSPESSTVSYSYPLMLVLKTWVSSDVPYLLWTWNGKFDTDWSNSVQKCHCFVSMKFLAQLLNCNESSDMNPAVERTGWKRRTTLWNLRLLFIIEATAWYTSSRPVHGMEVAVLPFLCNVCVLRESTVLNALLTPSSRVRRSLMTMPGQCFMVQLWSWLWSTFCPTSHVFRTIQLCSFNHQLDISLTFFFLPTKSHWSSFLTHWRIAGDI